MLNKIWLKINKTKMCCNMIPAAARSWLCNKQQTVDSFTTHFIDSTLFCICLSNIEFYFVSVNIRPAGIRMVTEIWNNSVGHDRCNTLFTGGRRVFLLHCLIKLMCFMILRHGLVHVTISRNIRRVDLCLVFNPATVIEILNRFVG